MRLCPHNKRHNTLMSVHNCRAHLFRKLRFTVTSLDPMAHCLCHIRPAFISFNALCGAHLPMDKNNEVHLIIVNIIIYRMQHYSHNPFYLNAGINEIAAVVLSSATTESRTEERKSTMEVPHRSCFLNSEMCL